MRMNDRRHLAPRIQQLRIRQEQPEATRCELDRLLSDRRVDLADMDTVSNHVQDLRCLRGESSPAERRSFIKSFFKEVNVKDTEVVMTYTMPLANKVAINEELGVPSIIQLWWAVQYNRQNL